jgi:hypothetical protein
MRQLLLAALLVAFLCTSAHTTKEKDGSKDQRDTGIVMFWPNQDNAILKLTFSRFQNLATYGGQMTLVSDVVVQNLSTKLIPGVLQRGVA